MAKASIHIKECNVARSEAHNKRTKELDYVRKDLSHLNESFYFDQTPLTKLKKQIAKEVKTKTGRAMQKNAVPIQEAVAVIKEDTTMDELIKFCRRIQDRWGITPLQIHIHRDEGHMRSAAVRAWRKDPDNNSWKPNLHAHIHWRSVLNNGKSVRLSPADCEEMQTLYAECVGMERGKRTGRKGLSAIEFKLQAKEQELAELMAMNETQGKTIAEQQTEMALKSQEIEKLKTDKARIEKARQKAQEEAQRAENARIKADHDNADAQRKLTQSNDKLHEALNDLNETMSVIEREEQRMEQLRKTNDHLERGLNYFAQNIATSLKGATEKVVAAIENTSAKKTLFGSAKDTEERSKLRSDALSDLNKVVQNPMALLTEAVALPEEIRQEYRRMDQHAEDNRYNEMQHKTETPARAQTNADLRKRHEKEAQLLDEINIQQLPEESKAMLLEGKEVKVEKKWYDSENAKWTDKAEAVVRVKDWHLTFNGSTLRDFLNYVWMKMEKAAQELKEKIQQGRKGGFKL